MAFHRLSALGALLGSALSLTAAGCAGGIENGDYVLIRVAYADTQKDAACYTDGEIPKEVAGDSSTTRAGATFALYRGTEESWYLDTGEEVFTGTFVEDTFTFEGGFVDVEYLNGQPAQVILDSDHDNIEDFNDPMIDADMDGMDDEGFNDEVVDVDGDGLDDRGQDNLVDANGDGEDDRYTVVTPATDGDKYTLNATRTVSFTITNDNVVGTATLSSKTTCKGATCPSKLPDCTQEADFVGTVVKDAAIEHQL